MAKPEIEQFLTFLAVEKKVSPTTQNQAFSAILFLYIEVLGMDMSEQNIQALRAQERKHIPVVLTREEVHLVIDNLMGIYHLIVSLMYATHLLLVGIDLLSIQELLVHKSVVVADEQSKDFKSIGFRSVLVWFLDICLYPRVYRSMIEVIFGNYFT